MKQFEYKILDVPVKRKFFTVTVDYEALSTSLNAAGKQGWEVVSMSTTNAYQGISIGVIIILKREI